MQRTEQSFFAAGVFYYFMTEDMKVLLHKMAMRFPKAVIVFDSSPNWTLSDTERSEEVLFGSATSVNPFEEVV